MEKLVNAERDRMKMTSWSLFHPEALDMQPLEDNLSERKQVLEVLISENAQSGSTNTADRPSSALLMLKLMCADGLSASTTRMNVSVI